MQMRALFVIFLFYNIVLCENKVSKKRKSPEILTVLGYLRGYKLGHELKIPAFLISPIIIVPQTNQENPERVDSAENELEVSETFQKVIPVGIILNSSKEDNNDIEVNFRQALNRGNLSKNDTMSKVLNNETLNKSEIKLNVSSIAGNTSNENATTLETTTTEINAHKNVTEVLTSTEPSGLYPTAVYNNQTVNTLTITARPPNYFLLPPLIDEEWKNFTVTTDINIVKENTTNSDNTIISPLVNETDSPIKGPYPAAMYYNAEIDQLSITTNSYTNESPLPPPQDDRWTSFSSMGGTLSASNEFRPLAGLYYDGFLHRPPPKNPGFVPYNQYFL